MPNEEEVWKEIDNAGASIKEFTDMIKKTTDQFGLFILGVLSGYKIILKFLADTVFEPREEKFDEVFDKYYPEVEF